MRKVMLWGGAALVAITIMGSVLKKEKAPAPVAESRPVPTRSADLKSCIVPVGDMTAETSQFATTATGRVKNECGRNFSYLQLSFRLKSGDAVVGSALANVNGLRAGETWEYKAVGMAKAERIELDQVTGW